MFIIYSRARVNIQNRDPTNYEGTQMIQKNYSYDTNQKYKRPIKAL